MQFEVVQPWRSALKPLRNPTESPHVPRETARCRPWSPPSAFSSRLPQKRLLKQPVAVPPAVPRGHVWGPHRSEEPGWGGRACRMLGSLAGSRAAVWGGFCWFWSFLGGSLGSSQRMRMARETRTGVSPSSSPSRLSAAGCWGRGVPAALPFGASPRPLGTALSRRRGAGSRGHAGLPPAGSFSSSAAGATWTRASSAWPASGSSG